MLAEIRDEGMTGRDFVERAKSKDDTSRLMGFGHRVYKNFDPRARIIKKACFDVLNSLGVHSRLLEIAVELEEIVLKDDYFVERKLYPNVDFLFRCDLQRHRHTLQHVHSALCHWPTPRVDRAVDGTPQRPRLQDWAPKAEFTWGPKYGHGRR